MAQLIFNFVQLLRNEFPNENIYPIEQYRLLAETQVPDRRILIREISGEPKFIINIPGIQVLIRDIDPYNARNLAFEFYDFLHGTDGRKGQGSRQSVD
jgi:hypothetical protein